MRFGTALALFLGSGVFLVESAVGLARGRLTLGRHGAIRPEGASAYVVAAIFGLLGGILLIVAIGKWRESLKDSPFRIDYR